MHGHFLHRLALAGFVLLLALAPRIAQADEKKGGRDKRTPADIAHSECSSLANGSKEVILYGLAGGIVSFALARERYIKDCVTRRGYEFVPKRRKKIEYSR